MSDPESSSVKREAIANDLYRVRSSSDAEQRLRANSCYGSLDFEALIVDRLAPEAGSRVVDIGCGSGSHLAAFSEKTGGAGSVIGADFSIAALQRAGRRLERTWLVAADACRLPIRSRSADRVCCNFALYYFRDVAQAVREMVRILAPGGRLLLTGPALDNNHELYAFHRKISGMDISDADIAALGFVADRGFHEIRSNGLAARAETITNRIVFPTPEAFMAYYANTSLYLRTFGSERPDFRAELGGGEFLVTKKVTVISADSSEE